MSTVAAPTSKCGREGEAPDRASAGPPPARRTANQAEPPDRLARVVEAVEANLDRVVESMMTAYRAHIPSYAAANPELMADVRAGAQATVLVGLSTLRGEATPEGLEAALAALGRR